MSDKPKIEVLPIEQGATPDQNNVNKHTQRGGGLLENSLRKRGAFRSIASAGKGVDTPVVYAGNFTLEKALDAGFTEIVNVHVNGQQLVNVVRDDIAPDSPEAVALGIEDNEIGKQSYNPDVDVLAALAAGDNSLLSALREDDRTFDNLLNSMGADQDPTPADPRKTLAERFGVPPFSVLDARQGYWQERKQAWIALGIRGELGRGEALLMQSEQVTTEGLNYGSNLAKQAGAKVFGSGGPGELSAAFKSQSRKSALQKGKGKKTLGAIAPNESGENGILSSPGKYSVKDSGNGLLGKSEQARSHYKKQDNFVNGVLMTSDSGNDPAYYFKKQQKEKEFGRALTTAEFQQLYYEGPDTYQSGTSIFDPVLCELVYRWFSPVGGSVLDPFAGESTKGIVAEFLKHPYTGIELRQEQVDANNKQALDIGLSPKWITGDSSNLDKLLPAGVMYDLVFSSPPYFDLEVYSQDENDGSAFGDYDKFILWYRDIFTQAVSRLNDGRFLVVKIGEIRAKNTGVYRNFLGDNIKCFLDLGLHYYNEMVLVTAVGSLPIRVGRQFEASRKVGKTHQNILVFYKGDPKKIGSNFSKEIEYADLSGETD